MKMLRMHRTLNVIFNNIIIYAEIFINAMCHTYVNNINTYCTKKKRDVIVAFPDTNFSQRKSNAHFAHPYHHTRAMHPASSMFLWLLMMRMREFICFSIVKLWVLFDVVCLLCAPSQMFVVVFSHSNFLYIHTYRYVLNIYASFRWNRLSTGRHRRLWYESDARIFICWSSLSHTHSDFMSF